MTDDDMNKLVVDIADARAMAITSMCLQGSLSALLIKKGVISKEEALEISAFAKTGLETVYRLSPIEREIANGALQGWAASLASHLTRH